MATEALFGLLSLLAVGEPASAPEAEESFRPHVVGDIRSVTLIRASNNYFDHAQTFRYDLGNDAAGIGLTLGAELLPRLSVFGEAFYTLNGADRSDAQLRLSSGAVLGAVRYAVFRWTESTEHMLIDVSLTGGAGRYLLKETYIDPSLSPQRYTQTDGSYGGFGSVEAAGVMYGVRLSLGYAFHYARASIGDRIGGVVYAGGHEVYVGAGVRL